MPLLFTLFSLIAFCNILFVKSQTFHVTDQAITANLLLRSGIAPSENDDLVNLKYIEEQFALYRTSVLKESQRDSFHQSVRSASCPVPEFLSVVSTGSRTYVPLTGYTEVPQVYVTAYTPTPVFSVPVNITANGFFIMTVLKNMEETDIASHYDIMVVPEKSNANFCPSMRNWSKTLTGANTYSITALPVAPTCLISPVFDDFITESIRVRFKEYSTTTAFTPWRYPNHGEVTVVCFTENYLPEKTQTGTADLSTVVWSYYVFCDV
eukprot:TRINITY_DN2327_c0_g1_i3.p1 TRINITY_DN2327_c0_g1~~TRINITY_DN2327_c0_g1_i3.p1  ORF type:complete len:266 (+),score=25.20 TRINITY_DN2327_c0_g1_i3:54-851(+)